MWILSQDSSKIVNSNQIKNIFIEYFDGYVSGYKLKADDFKIGDFKIMDEARKELKKIYDALISGQESYSVG